MSNENSQNGTTPNVSTTETPPPPIANGSSNGAAAHTTAEPPVEAPVVTAPLQGERDAPAADATATAEASTSTSASASTSKKDKRRDRKKERETKNAVSSDAAAKVFPTAETTAPANPEAASVAAEPETATADVEKTDAEKPTPTPDPQPVRAAPPAPEQPTAGAPPIAAQEGGLRLRMKVWTDPETLKRYLVATAFMRDMVNGQPVSDIMRAYAMSEEDTRVITLRVVEWNTLPFYYFQEDGIAPRASRRPVDRLG
jgi:hypothetical protein